MSYREVNATIRPRYGTQPVLLTLKSGAPPVYMTNLVLLGHLRVEDDSLITLTDCVIEPQSGNTGRRLSISTAGRAVSIVGGGEATLRRTILRGHEGGAIAVSGATLTLIECTIRDSKADRGGAILVTGESSSVMIVMSNFTRNEGFVSGGALQVCRAVQTSSCAARKSFASAHISYPQVEGGLVSLSDETLIERNEARDGFGISIHLVAPGRLTYTLPAPPGRWLNMKQGATFVLDPGPEDLDFPYACSPGVVGGSLPQYQKGPGCKSQW